MRQRRGQRNIFARIPHTRSIPPSKEQCRMKGWKREKRLARVFVRLSSSEMNKSWKLILHKMCFSSTRFKFNSIQQQQRKFLIAFAWMTAFCILLLSRITFTLEWQIFRLTLAYDVSRVIWRVEGGVMIKKCSHLLKNIYHGVEAWRFIIWSDEIPDKTIFNCRWPPEHIQPGSSNSASIHPSGVLEAGVDEIQK
jgi:hypothetical protein